MAILQQVYKSSGELFTTASTIDHDDTIPQITEGADMPLFSVDITPGDAANFILFEGQFYLASSVNESVVLALFRDGGSDAIAVSTSVSGASWGEPMPFLFRQAAGTTNEINYTFRIGSATGTTNLNGPTGTREYGGVINSAMLVTEETV